MPTGLRFQTDEDLVKFEPNIAEIWPRKKDWDVQHALSMDQIERFFTNRKDVAERFVIGAIGLRDQERLRVPAACLSLHYIYVAADTQGDADGFFARKASHYWNRAHEMLEGISLQLDYDSDGDGAIGEEDKNQPAPCRVIRGG